MRISILAAAVGVALASCVPTVMAADAPRPGTPAKDPNAAAAPAPATSVEEALTRGKATVGFRVRSEGVDDDAFTRDANALTLRTRVGWTSASLGGFSMQAEVDDVRALVDDYNSTNGGDLDRPVIGDPEGTEINVAAVQWNEAAWGGTLGRQRLTFDNQRFVGNVGWRQNEQTYDAVSVRTKSVPRTDLTYAYVANVNRVFGPQNGGSQAANWHGDTHLFNAKVGAGAAGTVTLFAYLMDFDNAKTQSNATYGALWTGSAPLSADWKLPFALSFATQEDYGDNPVAYSADYWQVEAGIAYRAITFKAGRETLAGDAARSGRMFRTPLATLHAWQGWADKFLTTPAQGIEDTYVGVTAKVRGFDLQAVWHDYGAEAVSRDYGTELNVSAGYRFAKRYDVLVKIADYRADGFAADTTKYWLQVGASF